MALISAVVRMAVAGAALSLCACSVYHMPGQTPAPVEEPPDYSVVTPAPGPAAETEPDREEPLGDIPPQGAVAAYGPLLAKAEQASARGDFEGALALLERAQRIEPDAADIYLALAKTHDARGDFRQARANAERGLLYCTGEQQCAALRHYAR